MTFPVPENETERLAAIFDHGLQGSTGSPEFDAIANLASDVLDCPMALISLLGETEQWFKAKCGLESDVSPREVSFCNYTIMGRRPMIVNDAREDERFKDNPLVTGEPHVVFYAGAPISIDGVHNLGTLCVIDTRPRQFTDLQLKRLTNLSRAAEGLIAAFKSKRHAERAQQSEVKKGRELERTASLLEQITKLSGVGGWELVLEPQALTWTNGTKSIHEVALDYEPGLDQAIEFYAPDAKPVIAKAVEDAIATGSSWDLELPMVTARGKEIWVRAVGAPTYEDGSVVGLIGAVQDISERKQTETRIRESELAAHKTSEELRTILDNMEEGVSVFDAESKLVLWNQKYIEIFDKPPGEVRSGVPFRHLLECEKARGDFPGDIDQHLQDLHDQMFEQVPVISQFRTQKGKIISSTHAPLPNGGWVGTHSDVTAQVLAAERDEHASRHDPLTGLPNRLAFHTRMDAIVAKRDVVDHSLILMLVDLDKFKEANDTFGHLVGDAVLKEASQRLRNCLRKDDLVARLGGDEFAIVIECDGQNSVGLAEMIATDIASEMKRPFEIDGNGLTIGASIGVFVSPSRQVEVDDTVAKADAALYESKRSGRGRHHFYDEKISAHVNAIHTRHEAVESAVRDESLWLEFQPIFDLISLKPCGAEALVRFRNDDLGVLPTSEMVSIAEVTGAIDQIGNWVLERSMREAASWADDLTVSVNVSPRQLGKGRLRDRIKELLEETQFPAVRLELEITESALLFKDSASLTELGELKSLGVKIVLDDFGTGYASLSYLQRFPFDKIKIDKSFVIESGTNSEAGAIVGAVAKLAQELGIEITAEGIETPEALHRLRDLGCTYGQGFLLSKPLGAGDFAASKQIRLDVA